MKTRRTIKNKIINKLKEHNIIEKEKALDILIEKLNRVEGSEFVFNGKYSEFHDDVMIIISRHGLHDSETVKILEEIKDEFSMRKKERK